MAKKRGRVCGAAFAGAAMERIRRKLGILRDHWIDGKVAGCDPSERHGRAGVWDGGSDKMNGMTVLLGVGIVMGCALFSWAVLRAHRYANGKRPENGQRGVQGLVGVGWIALAACGALYVFTSITVMARLTEKEAEITRRRTLVASQDRKIHVYRDGLKKVRQTLSEAKDNPANQRLANHIEMILNEIRERERKLP